MKKKAMKDVACQARFFTANNLGDDSMLEVLIKMISSLNVYAMTILFLCFISISVFHTREFEKYRNNINKIKDKFKLNKPFVDKAELEQCKTQALEEISFRERILKRAVRVMLAFVVAYLVIFIVRIVYVDMSDEASLKTHICTFSFSLIFAWMVALTLATIAIKNSGKDVLDSLNIDFGEVSKKWMSRYIRLLEIEIDSINKHLAQLEQEGRELTRLEADDIIEGISNINRAAEDLLQENKQTASAS